MSEFPALKFAIGVMNAYAEAGGQPPSCPAKSDDPMVKVVHECFVSMGSDITIEDATEAVRAIQATSSILRTR